MSTSAFIYARCTSGRAHYLEQVYQGTRSECRSTLSRMARSGRPTHFLIISSLPKRDATRRHCDGARWDEARCAYID